jgi:methylated-DNA-[protein]-cysteine S-methyltransferase
MPIHWTSHESPLGTLTLRGGPRGLTALRFAGHGEHLDEDGHAPALFAEAVRQLDEYHAGRRRRFDLALDLGGTAFQQRVWRHVLAIPYGETTTYTAVARAIGRPDRVRAVAAAVGRTPVPIIVPCHRVLAANGALTGYLGGLHRKRALLGLERRSVTGLEPPPDWSERQLALL